MYKTPQILLLQFSLKFKIPNICLKLKIEIPNFYNYSYFDKRNLIHLNLL